MTVSEKTPTHVSDPLRKFFLWEALPDDQWEEFRSHIRHLKAIPGEQILPRPETSGCLCVMESGQARVYTATPAGIHSSALIRTMEAGSVFGVHSIFSDGIPPQSRIIATKACRIHLIPAHLWETILSRYPDILASYVRFLTGRIQFLNQKVRYLCAGSSERRLALYLLTEIPEEGIPTHLKHSAVTLADLLHISRASLYRAMQRLTDDGFLIRNGREYVLYHRDLLADSYRQSSVGQPKRTTPEQ